MSAAELNPLRSPYGPQGRLPDNWRTVERWVRVHRANQRCEICGAADLRPHPKDGIICYLHVTHRGEAETFKRHDLIAACVPCLTAGRHRNYVIPDEPRPATLTQGDLLEGVV